MRKLDYNKLTLDITNWIKKYVESAKCRGVVLGLSGGIDSAATAALCVNALGKENVVSSFKALLDSINNLLEISMNLC